MIVRLCPLAKPPAAILNMVQGQTAKAVTIRTAVLKEEEILLKRTPGKIDLCGAPHE